MEKSEKPEQPKQEEEKFCTCTPPNPGTKGDSNKGGVMTCKDCGMHIQAPK